MKLLAIVFLAAAFVGLAFAGEGEKCEIINKRTGNKQTLDCNLDPETHEGPYYLPISLNRRDIREGEPGVPLHLALVVMNSQSCEPIANATVDIWQANATGVYSGFESAGTSNLTFLRGVQVTDQNGEVTFKSIYPGWYRGRCIHIHIEVFIEGNLKHVGQIYFPNTYTNAVRIVEPYVSNYKVLLFNELDWIYSRQGGKNTTFDNLDGDIDAGYSALMYIGINPQVESKDIPRVKHYNQFVELTNDIP